MWFYPLLSICCALSCVRRLGGQLTILFISVRTSSSFKGRVDIVSGVLNDTNERGGTNGQVSAFTQSHLLSWDQSCKRIATPVLNSHFSILSYGSFCNISSMFLRCKNLFFGDFSRWRWPVRPPTQRCCFPLPNLMSVTVCHGARVKCRTGSRVAVTCLSHFRRMREREFQCLTLSIPVWWC